MLPRNSTSHHRAVTPQHGTRWDRHTHRRVLLPKIVSIHSPRIFIGESDQRHSRSSSPARGMRLSMQVRRKCRAHKTPRCSFCRPASHSLEIDAQFRCNVKACSPHVIQSTSGPVPARHRENDQERSHPTAQLELRNTMYCLVPLNPSRMRATH